MQTNGHRTMTRTPSLIARSSSIASVLVLILAHGAVAHTTEPPSADPPATDPAVRPIRQAPGIILPTADPVSVPVVPGAPASANAIPGLGGADVLVPPGRLVREGYFLVRRTGVLLTAPTGERIVVFAPSAIGRDLPPMVLLPSPMLEAIEDAADASDDQLLRLSLTGQVLVYHSRNYLIPTLMTLLTGDPSPTTPASTDSTPAPSQPSSVSPADDPRVLDLIGQLERDARAQGARPQPPRMTPLTQADPDADNGLTQTIFRQRALSRQLGRLVRSPSGPWVFSIDSDPNSPAPPPMVVMPSMALERIERLAARAGEPLLIELSGRIMGYRGRAFVRPTMIVLHRSFDLKTSQ